MVLEQNYKPAYCFPLHIFEQYFSLSVALTLDNIAAKMTEVVGSNPTRSTFINLVEYGIVLSLFFRLLSDKFNSNANVVSRFTELNIMKKRFAIFCRQAAPCPTKQKTRRQNQIHC